MSENINKIEWEKLPSTHKELFVHLIGVKFKQNQYPNENHIKNFLSLHDQLSTKKLRDLETPPPLDTPKQSWEKIKKIIKKY